MTLVRVAWSTTLKSLITKYSALKRLATSYQKVTFMNCSSSLSGAYYTFEVSKVFLFHFKCPLSVWPDYFFDIWPFITMKILVNSIINLPKLVQILPNTTKTPLQIAKVLKISNKVAKIRRIWSHCPLCKIRTLLTFKLVQVTIRLPVLLSFCLLKHFSFEANEFSNRFENLNRF